MHSTHSHLLLSRPPSSLSPLPLTSPPRFSPQPPPAVHVAVRPPAPPHYAHLTLPDRHVRLHEPAHPSGHHLSGHSQRRCRDFHEGTGLCLARGGEGKRARVATRGGEGAAGSGGLPGPGARGEGGRERASECVCVRRGRGGEGRAEPGGSGGGAASRLTLCFVPRAAAPSPGPGQQGRQVHAGHFRGASLRYQGNPRSPPLLPGLLPALPPPARVAPAAGGPGERGTHGLRRRR